MNSEKEDIQLVKEINEGSIKAFEIIYSRYSEAAYYTIYKKLKNKDDVDDVFQDFFSSLWRKRTSLNVKTSFKAWLFTALRNHILNHLLQASTREKNMVIYTNTYSEEDHEFKGKMEILDLPQLVNNEINRLPEKMRTVWTLRKEQNLSISEISEQLKTSEQTIKNQLSTVTKRLKSFLTKVQLFLFF